MAVGRPPHVLRQRADVDVSVVDAGEFDRAGDQVRQVKRHARLVTATGLVEQFVREGAATHQQAVDTVELVVDGRRQRLGVRVGTDDGHGHLSPQRAQVMADRGDVGVEVLDAGQQVVACPVAGVLASVTFNGVAEEAVERVGVEVTFGEELVSTLADRFTAGGVAVVGSHRQDRGCGSPGPHRVHSPDGGVGQTQVQQHRIGRGGMPCQPSLGQRRDRADVVGRAARRQKLLDERTEVGGRPRSRAGSRRPQVHAFGGGRQRQTIGPIAGHV